MCIVDVGTNDAHSIFVAISQVRISLATHNRSMHIMAGTGSTSLRSGQSMVKLHLHWTSVSFKVARGAARSKAMRSPCLPYASSTEMVLERNKSS
jgi:hypothetical protein